MSLKDEATVRVAKQQYILKGPPPKTWSARMPAYAGTVLCLDQELWPKKGGDADGEGDSESVNKIKSRTRRLGRADTENTPGNCADGEQGNPGIRLCKRDP